MRVRHRTTTSLCLGAVALVLSLPSTGLAVLLSDLITNNGTVVNGDKTFSNFAYQGLFDMPAADEIDVSPTSFSGHLGIRFLGAFHDNAGGSQSTAIISYRVTATAPGFFISDAHMDGTPDVTASVGGHIQIDEIFAQAPEHLSIFHDANNAQTADNVTFAALYSFLDVEKTIVADGGEQGVASIGHIDQVFSQVPEPSTFFLGIVSALGFFLVARRHKS